MFGTVQSNVRERAKVRVRPARFVRAALLAAAVVIGFRRLVVCSHGACCTWKEAHRDQEGAATLAYLSGAGECVGPASHLPHHDLSTQLPFSLSFSRSLRLHHCAPSLYLLCRPCLLRHHPVTRSKPASSPFLSHGAMEVLAMDFVSPWAVTAPYGGCARRGHYGDGCRSSSVAPTRARSAPAWRPHSSVGRHAHDGSVVLRFETPGFPRSALHLDLSEDATRLNVSGKLTREGGKASPPTVDGSAAAAADSPAAAEGAATAGASGGVAGEPAAAASAGGGATTTDAEVVKSFELAYRLPRDVDASAITASYEFGVLTVQVPKKAVVAESRNIPILD